MCLVTGRKKVLRIMLYVGWEFGRTRTRTDWVLCLAIREKNVIRIIWYSVGNWEGKEWLPQRCDIMIQLGISG